EWWLGAWRDATEKMSSGHQGPRRGETFLESVERGRGLSLCDGDCCLGPLPSPLPAEPGEGAGNGRERGAGEGGLFFGALALVDLGGADVAEAVPADVAARQVEQDLLVGRAALQGGLDPVQGDLARVGGVEDEGLAEDDPGAVGDDARLEQVAAAEAGG